jgi:selenide,water dikinase
MGPLDLQRILKPLAQYNHPDLLVGLKTGDDAAVFRLGDRAVIETVDFFAPVVDDPYQYGAIAAANAMSDVYAMGGEVLFALNVTAFPEDLPAEIISAILQGGAEKVTEAGGVIVGGHTVIDREPKYGLCVTGIGDPSQIATKGQARPGEVLVLTKPLGTGAITTAHKAGVVEEAHLQAAVASMLQLNRTSGRLLRQAGVLACTDVTGFGLLGHASEMAEASGLMLRIEAGKVPLLPGAIDYARAGTLPGGLGRNRAYLLGTGEGSGVRVHLADSVLSEVADLLMDPETSGGLLAAVEPERLERLLAAFAEAGADCWVIGETAPGSGIEVV